MISFIEFFWPIILCGNLTSDVMVGKTSWRPLDRLSSGPKIPKKNPNFF